LIKNIKGIAQICLLALMCFSSIVEANSEKSAMSPLDKVLELARSNPQKQAQYYTLLLNTTLYIPTTNKPENEINGRAPVETTFSPMVFDISDKPYIMLFDSKERLGNWAGREVGFFALPGHAFVEAIGTDFYWAINAGTQSSKTFTLEEIAWLKDQVEKANPQTQVVQAGVNVKIGEPAKIADGLLDTLRNVLQKNSEIKKAYLGWIYIEKKNEIPHYALLLDAPDTSQSVLSVIKKDIAVASLHLIRKPNYIDIFVVGEHGEFAASIQKAVKPFYTSP